MYRWSWKSAVVALLVAGHIGFASDRAEGGPILDWLFGTQPSTNQPVVAYYPLTTSYYPPASYQPPHGSAGSAYYGRTTYYRGSYVPAQPAAGYSANYAPGAAVTYHTVAPRVTSYYGNSALQGTGSCQSCAAPASTCGTPTVVYQSPEIMCGPAPVACPPQQPSRMCLGSCLGRGAPPATVSPVRPTYYRTTWKRVPVTRYRPVTSADPVTGCQVTVMKACTTYSWQPERRRCGFFARLFGRCDPGPAASACPPDPCAVQCVPSPSCCTPSPSCCAPATPGVAVPIPAGSPYYAPGPAAPAPGSSVMPPSSGAAPSLAPQDMTPGGNEPANVQPSLVPGEPGSGIRAPLQGSNSRWESDVPAAAESGSGLAGPEMSEPQQAASAPLRLGRPVPLPPRGGPSANPTRPQPNPVPDPDAAPVNNHDDSNAPQLLAPRDRVASLGTDQAWAYTTIAWPQNQTTPRREVVPVAEPLDDSGWYSIAQ